MSKTTYFDCAVASALKSDKKKPRDLALAELRRGNHSPAPFALKEAESTIPVVDANGKTIASVKYRDKDFSDACLFAASAEMYYALKWMRDYVFDGHRSFTHEELKELVIAALAKAEGR